jgi:hypothetical protein
MSFKAKNHYVPRMYLKGFQSAPGRAFTYRTLVAHPRVHVWKQHFIEGVG